MKRETDQTGVAGTRRTVLILQGGGALGAYQGGVFEAMAKAGLQPDWVIGTSIGAINAALIAGNRPERRTEHLYEFWARVGQRWFPDPSAQWPAGSLLARWNALATMLVGLPGFFAPRWMHGFPCGMPVCPDSAGIYDTDPLRHSLEELVDFDYLNDGPMRISVGAVDVESGRIRYFDSAREPLGAEHVLASGALPPAFPAVNIEGRYYWDGGIHSNTPLEWLLADEPRQDSLCFLATLWPLGDEAPRSLAEVLRRRKELQYASRADTLIRLEQELHRLRHGLALLGSRRDAEQRRDPQLAEAIALGCRSTYHLVRLEAPRLACEDENKDIDFAPTRVGQRWSAGYRQALRALQARPWQVPVAACHGLVVHDFGDAADIEAASREPLA